MDFLTPLERSQRMSRIRGQGTRPELRLAAELAKSRLRFVTNDGSLPGKPDFVFRRSKTVVFLHGCYWHGHSCQNGRIPATNSQFWAEKFERNRSRDRRVSRQLRKMGWHVLTVWECRIRANVGCQSESRRILAFVRRNGLAKGPPARR